MATTSPNFGLILATTSDQVSVTSHVANNFSTVDTLLGVVHTGTGQLKSGVVLTNPTLAGAALSGTLSGGTIVATTGSFQTITATGGLLTVNTLNVGNYNIVGTIGSSGHVLTVVTGNASWAAQAPGTGANGALSNLAAVAINTNLNTFTAGFVTVTRLITTSGAMTGLTSFQATTGTFAGVLTALGTINANVLNVTGGAITAGGLAIGTYAMPSTIGSTGQILTVTTGNAVWLTPNLAQTSAYFRAYLAGTTVITAQTTIVFDTEEFDSSTQFDTASGVFTVTASGYYLFGAHLVSTLGTGAPIAVLSGSLSHIIVGDPLGAVSGTAARSLTGSVLVRATSGEAFSIVATAATGTYTLNPYVIGTLSTQRSTFWGYKIPDV